MGDSLRPLSERAVSGRAAVRGLSAGSTFSRAPRSRQSLWWRFRRDLQTGFLEAVGKHGPRVAIGEAAGLRAEHDQDELLARAPGRHRQVVTGGAREARLE